MSILKKQIHEGVKSIKEFSPIFNSSIIYFPVSVEVIDTDVYCGDARSFGYPIDEGMLTEVSYEPVMGALVEDICALRSDIIAKERVIKKSMKVELDDYLESSRVQPEEWDIGLDKEWMKTANIYGGIELADDPENITLDDITYWNWNQEHRHAYDNYIKKLLSVMYEKKPLLIDDAGYSLFELDDTYYIAIITSAATWWRRFKRDEAAVETVLEKIKAKSEFQQQINVAKKHLADTMIELRKMAERDYAESQDEK
jgi:hypothetical protein